MKNIKGYRNAPRTGIKAGACFLLFKKTLKKTEMWSKMAYLWASFVKFSLSPYFPGITFISYILTSRITLILILNKF